MNTTERCTESEVIKILTKYMRKSCPDMTDFSKPDPGIGLLVELCRRKLGEFRDASIPKNLECYPFNEDALSERDMKYLKQNLPMVFLLHYQLFSRPSYEYYSPFLSRQIYGLISALLGIDRRKDCDEIYNPYAGTLDLAYAASFNHDKRIVCEEVDQRVVALGKIWTMINGGDVSAYELSDKLSLPDAVTERGWHPRCLDRITRKDKRKIIITSLAARFGATVTNVILNRLYIRMADDGVMACVVNEDIACGVVSDNPASEDYPLFLKRALKDRTLSAVIKLPDELFPHFCSGGSVYILLVAKGHKSESVLMADATSYLKPVKEGVFDQLDCRSLLQNMALTMDDGKAVYNVRRLDVPVSIRVDVRNIVENDVRPEVYLRDTGNMEGWIPLSELATQVKELSEADDAELYFDCKHIPRVYHAVNADSYVRPYNPKSGEAHFVKLTSECVALMASAESAVNIRTSYIENLRGTIAFKPLYAKFLKPKRGVSAAYLAALIDDYGYVDLQFERYKLSGGKFKPDVVLRLNDIYVPKHTPSEREAFLKRTNACEMK